MIAIYLIDTIRDLQFVRSQYFPISTLLAVTNMFFCRLQLSYSFHNKRRHAIITSFKLYPSSLSSTIK